MGNRRYLELVCGDPDDIIHKEKGEESKQPATFSRFVLPFAYKKRQKDGHDALDLCFREDKPETEVDRNMLLQRKKYFTSETCRVLYEDARWLKVPRDVWDKSSWGRGCCFVNSMSAQKKSFCIRMSPPRLVLFEWNAEASEEKGPDILQTGFLMLDIWFDKGQKPIIDDLLCLNELFRCFDYPNYPEHWKYYKEALFDIPLEYDVNSGASASKRIGECGHDKHDKYRPYIQRWTTLLELPVKLDGQVFRLVPDGFTEKAIKWLCSEKQKAEADIAQPADYLVYSDYRAYVWSAAVLGKGGKSISRFCRTSQSHPWEFGHWIKFLNVDQPSSSGPSETARAISGFEKEWARKRTYKRWLHLGTWYGFNYHAGVTIQEPSIFIPHFRELYFDIILLLFYLRMTLFRFSNRLSQTCTKCEDLNDKQKEFRGLRNKFSRFTILYQFPLLSNQQQGIEMYEMARRHFDIEDFYNEVKSEIDNTHEYLEMVEANQLSRTANLIGRLGIPLAAGSLAAGLFGMNDFHIWECFSKGRVLNPDPEFWILFFIVAVTLAISWLLARKRFKDK